MLQNPSRTIERELTHLRLTTEEVFHETFRVLDEVKENPKDASFMMRGLWDNIYCDLRELDEDASEDELQLATSELVYIVMLMLSIVDGSWYTKLTMVLMEQITANSSHYDHLQMLFMPNLWRYGEERVKVYLNEYMESEDVWISDEIDECLQFIRNEKTAHTPEIAGIIIPEESVNTFRKYSMARQENEKVKLANLELQNQLAAAQRERDEAWKQSEEYKKAVADMEQHLGKSSVQLNTIAKCILRFPTYELQKEAFDKVNSVLVGTSWNEKAAEVLDTMLENLRKKEEQDMVEALKQPKNVIIKDSEVKIDSPQNVVYPQEGSLTNIGCNQQNSTFPTFLPPANEVQGQIGSQKNEQKGLTEK